MEIDGETHDVEHDAIKDERLFNRHGFTSLRFSNADIMDNLDGVLQRLLTHLDQLPARWVGTTPDPSSEEEG